MAGLDMLMIIPRWECWLKFFMSYPKTFLVSGIHLLLFVDRLSVDFTNMYMYCIKLALLQTYSVYINITRSELKFHKFFVVG